MPLRMGKGIVMRRGWCVFFFFFFLFLFSSFFPPCSCLLLSALFHFLLSCECFANVRPGKNIEIRRRSLLLRLYLPGVGRVHGGVGVWRRESEAGDLFSGKICEGGFSEGAGGGVSVCFSPLFYLFVSFRFSEEVFLLTGCVIF